MSVPESFHLNNFEPWDHRSILHIICHQLERLNRLKEGDVCVINFNNNKLSWICEMIQSENCQLNSDLNQPSDRETAPPPLPQEVCPSHHVMCEKFVLEL